METKEIDLTKYRNLHFKAVVNGGIVSGQIFPEATCHIRLDFGYKRVYLIDDDLSRLIDGKSIELNCSLISDFEIEPRDPETYRDWQVGDIIRATDGNTGRIIFRSGDFVAADIGGCLCYTCEEMHGSGWRLILTDIEQQIIDEKKKYEPQDGDICFVKTAAGNCFIFIKRDHKSDEEIHSYACFDTNLWSLCSAKVSCVCDRQSIRELRPATENEKQKLFDAMAKQGKRWNAEKKVVEDIPKPYEFKKGEPVLVRSYEFHRWIIAAYTSKDELGFIANAGVSVIHWKYCIPYNESTMHLLGTSEDYKEGE